MPRAVHLFFDFDDTLSDARALLAQFVPALGGALANRFGGDSSLWMAAVVPALEASRARYHERFVVEPLSEYTNWLGREREETARAVLLNALPDAGSVISDPGLESLAIAVQRDALERCQALFPGVRETVEAAGKVAVLHLASSQDSAYLTAALQGAGLAGRFVHPFGPDLVNCAKESPEYYRRVFNYAGIEPRDAVVVDDLPVCLEWAAHCGARAVLSSASDWASGAMLRQLT